MARDVSNLSFLPPHQSCSSMRSPTCSSNCQHKLWRRLWSTSTDARLPSPSASINTSHTDEWGYRHAVVHRRRFGSYLRTVWHNCLWSCWLRLWRRLKNGHRLEYVGADPSELGAFHSTTILVYSRISLNQRFTDTLPRSGMCWIPTRSWLSQWDQLRAVRRIGSAGFTISEPRKPTAQISCTLSTGSVLLWSCHRSRAVSIAIHGTWFGIWTEDTVDWTLETWWLPHSSTGRLIQQNDFSIPVTISIPKRPSRAHRVTKNVVLKVKIY